MPARSGAPRSSARGRVCGNASHPLRCHTPCCAEFTAITVATGVGFLAMGFISFVVKIVHIPVTQVILGQN